jgi:hypothetical protein
MGSNNSLFLSPSGRGKDGNDVDGWTTVAIAGGGAKNDWVITAGSHFGVDVTGKLYANFGYIAGWHMDSNSLYKGVIGGSNSMFLSSGGISYTGSIGGSNSGETKKWAITAGNGFGVDVNGNLYAGNAKIQGNIIADTITANSKGEIG